MITAINRRFKEEQAYDEWLYAETHRICSECGRPMLEGYVIDDGAEYYCCEECLHSHYSPEEYKEMFNNDIAYWTEWEEA